MSATLPAILFLWAGLSLGGALIAAPAKFRAKSLTRPVALEVGQMQFRSVAIAECILSVLLVLSFVVFGAAFSEFYTIPIFILAVQWLLVMPALDRRTNAVIAGDVLAPSYLHFVFIIAEVGKFISLLLLGARALIV